MKRGRPASGTEYEASERALRALRLRRAGLKNPQIATRLGVRPTSIPTMIKRALAIEATMQRETT